MNEERKNPVKSLRTKENKRIPREISDSNRAQKKERRERRAEILKMNQVKERGGHSLVCYSSNSNRLHFVHGNDARKEKRRVFGTMGDKKRNPPDKGP